MLRLRAASRRSTRRFWRTSCRFVSYLSICRSFARWLPRWRARAASEDSSRRHRLLPHAASLPLRPAPRSAPPPARAAACRASSRRAAARRSPRTHRAAACRTAACRTAARRLGRRMSGDDHRFGVWSPGVSPFPLLPTDPCRYSSLVAAASGAAKHRTQSRHLEVLLEAFD